MLYLLIVYSVVLPAFAFGHGYHNGIRSHRGHGNQGNTGYNGYFGGNNNEWRNNHMQKHTPIMIPHLDRNGCRFPGDVVCNPGDTGGTTYGYCVLSDENKNLWKKPSMQTVVATCAPTGTGLLSDWCNDNERLLRAMGFIRNKEKHAAHYNHQKKYTALLQPCLLVAAPAIATKPPP